jgi:tetratricopeptide (TPR) repeat protein
VDTNKFAEAQKLYGEKDYRRAARAFLESIEKGTPIGNGPAYHMAGNSFMQLKRYSDAVTVYEHALRDDTYQRRGAVESNLANSYLHVGDYSAAVAHYEAALGDSDASGYYKYYQGMALAYMKQENYEAAALAYKHAALDEQNPKPGGALLNLGLAMMAAGKPDAAVEAYRAALSSAGYDNKGRALLNLGIAYHAQGKWREAIRSIEEAQMLHGYESSTLAIRTIKDARARLAIEEQVEATDVALVGEDMDSELEPLEEEIVPGVIPDDAHTAPSAILNEGAQSKDFDTASDHALTALAPDDFGDAESDSDLDSDASDLGIGDPSEVETFFARTEKEIAAEGRKTARAARSRFGWVKPVIIVVLVLAVLGGAVAALYYTGQGLPSAKTTVTELLDAYNQGKSIAPMWTYDAQDTATRQMVLVPASIDYTINKVVSAPNVSSVDVSISTDTGANLDFTFDLAREGIGWKVASLTANY